MKKVTLWYKLSDSGERVFNHLEDGWHCTCDTLDSKPKPIKEEYSNQVAWSKSKWEKEEAYLDENYTVVKFSDLYRDEILSNREMELISILKHRGVALQITFDLGKKPTVHAISEKGLVKTEGVNLMEALLKLDRLLFVV